jgi:hypothetical protein
MLLYIIHEIMSYINYFPQEREYIPYCSGVSNVLDNLGPVHF